MAKEKLTANAPAETGEILPAAAQRIALVQELAAAQADKTRLLARELNYQGSCDPAVLENSARDAIRRIGAGIFELGGYLLLLREACDHGDFLPTLERLRIEPRAAQRYMAVTRRFANTTLSTHLEAVGMSKMVELLPLDDEQAEDLVGLGETGELKLDDVARMSVRELRKAVRHERAEKRRQKEVNDELNREVVQLKLDKRVVAHTDWPLALSTVVEQVAAAGRKLAQGLSELAECRMAIFDAGHELAGDERVSFEAALVHVAELYGDALGRAERGLERERVTYDKTLGAFDAGEQTP